MFPTKKKSKVKIRIYTSVISGYDARWSKELFVKPKYILLSYKDSENYKDKRKLFSCQPACSNKLDVDTKHHFEKC